MRIAVGSANPVKRQATERALAGAHSHIVVSEAVPSGVAEQPRGQRETVTGARNRAERARGAGDYDLGVGLEGGVVRIDGADGLFVTMWSAATDGERVEFGGGPRIRLPEAIVSRVAGGEELGPVMAEITGDADLAENEGAAGVLTTGRVDRESALAHAAAGALGPLL